MEGVNLLGFVLQKSNMVVGGCGVDSIFWLLQLIVIDVRFDSGWNGKEKVGSYSDFSVIDRNSKGSLSQRPMTFCFV